ncbi:19012_t:CDS:2 [Racocetra persica]|uniref:19012_t:CDS:1 n=1 Tax=Racocetra persica TaxID=160502 RepID=A0ACA9K836_9GLOM|nr:19012_t:CDS:2 [Racocetra persica]
MRLFYLTLYIDYFIIIDFSITKTPIEHQYRLKRELAARQSEEQRERYKKQYRESKARTFNCVTISTTTDSFAQPQKNFVFASSMNNTNFSIFNHVTTATSTESFVQSQESFVSLSTNDNSSFIFSSLNRFLTPHLPQEILISVASSTLTTIHHVQNLIKDVNNSILQLLDVQTIDIVSETIVVNVEEATEMRIS